MKQSLPKLKAKAQLIFNEAHLIGYAERLPGRIGEDAFEWLKKQAAEYKRNGHKWSRSELLEIIETYKNKLKNYETQRKDFGSTGSSKDLS